MSKFDLLNERDTAEAKSLGWTVDRIYHLDKAKWVVQIYPADAALAVVGMARNNNPLAIRALQLVMAGHQGK